MFNSLHFCRTVSTGMMTCLQSARWWWMFQVCSEDREGRGGEVSHQRLHNRDETGLCPPATSGLLWAVHPPVDLHCREQLGGLLKRWKYFRIPWKYFDTDLYLGTGSLGCGPQVVQIAGTLEKLYSLLMISRIIQGIRKSTIEIPLKCLWENLI